MEIYHYGFILFCNIKQPKSSAFIGNRVSSETKLLGNVLFHPEQLESKNGVKLSKQYYQQYYLVRYTLKTGTNWVDQIEVIETFAKSQYKGILSVDGIGTVSFQKEGESVPVVLNGRKREKEGAVMELPFSFFDISDLNMIPQTLENGLKVLELVLPYERILKDAGDGEWKVGLVNYYVPSRMMYIRNHYENKRFMEGEFDDNLSLFSAEELPDTDMVGRVNTGKNVYFVRYQLNGEELPNPREPQEFLPRATKVCFVAKIPLKRVVRIAQEENGVRIALCADGLGREKEKIKQIELTPGEAVDNFLNRYITNCLQEGRITEGLEMVEKYKDQLSEERYQTIRFRLLPRLYKDTLSEESRIQTIEAIDSLLTFTNKVNFRLTLYLEKGNKLLQGRQLNEAAEAYRAWIELYNEHVAANPAAESGLKVAYRQVRQGLSICRGEDGEIDHQILEEQVTEDSYGDIGLDDFLVERLEREDLQGLGRENAEKYQDFSTLSKEDAEELGLFLEQQERVSEKNLWMLAKIYTYLSDAPVEVLDENIAAARRDQYLELALLQDALHLAKKGEENGKSTRLTVQFLCTQALAFHVDECRVAAALGACCLTAQQFESALEGRLSVHKVIELARIAGKLPQIAKCLAIICYRNGSVRKWMYDYLAEDMYTADETMKALGQALSMFTKEAQKGTSSAKEALSAAADGYQVFYRAFIQVSRDGSISSEAEGLHQFLNNPAYKVWLDNEAVDKSVLGECFHLLEDFELMKGFSQQSDRLLKAAKTLTKYVDEIPNRPSLISYQVYLPRLDELNGKVLNKYRHLCKTTKPVLTVSPDVDVEMASEDGRQLILTIPVSIGANKVQDAQDVTLIVDESPDFTCDREFLIAGNMPSDGRVVTATVPVQLKNPINGPMAFRVRVECKYISDVVIEEQFNNKGRGKRKHVRRGYRFQAVTSKACYPKIENWANLEITVERKKEKPAIKTKRIQLFSDDGRVRFKEKGIQKILRNREAQIERAIDVLTMEGEDEAEGMLPVLSDMGRWVLIYGQWRVGKTVILNCIEERLRKIKDAVVVKLTCTGSDQEDFESFFAQRIYDAIYLEILDSGYEEAFEWTSEKVRGAGNRAGNLSWDELKNFIVLFMRRIRKEKPQAGIVLLVDEFTEIYQAIIKGHAGEGFPARWTDFINVTNLLCVTAGGEHTVSLMETYTPNTLQKAEEHIYVQYLTLENVNEYVHYVFYEAQEDEVAEEDSYFSSSYPQALERIFELTRGNAFLLKLFCSKLIDYMNEKKRPYLTRRDVDATLDYIIRREDRDSLETKYFNSLYNPFNEESGSERSSESEEGREQMRRIKRIDDDKVRKDNLDILHKIVERANRDTHICAYDELADVLKPVMGDEIFERRMTTLANRKIIEMDENENVRVFIDLYYELVKRLS